MTNFSSGVRALIFQGVFVQFSKFSRFPGCSHLRNKDIDFFSKKDHHSVATQVLIYFNLLLIDGKIPQDTGSDPKAKKKKQQKTTPVKTTQDHKKKHRKERQKKRAQEVVKEEERKYCFVSHKTIKKLSKVKNVIDFKM